MKALNGKITVKWIFVTVFFSAFLFSCSSKQKEQEESLVKLAKSIIIDNEASNSNQIENTISSIKSFLSEYPDSKRYFELSNYLDDLYNCLDFHKVREFTEKYEDLSSKSYSDFNSAIQEQESFLDQFSSEYGTQLIVRQPQVRSYIEEIKEIREEFKTMKSFFEREFSDLASYNSEVLYNSGQFENSKFETVQVSWKAIANSQRSEQATKDMNKKVAKFEEYLKSDAERICDYNYNDFVVDDNNSTQTISVGTPFQHDSYNAKVCEGVFRVYLKGAYVGWDKGTARISVKGMVVVTVDENQIKTGVEYRNLDFSILEATGDL